MPSINPMSYNITRRVQASSTRKSTTNHVKHTSSISNSHNFGSIISKINNKSNHNTGKTYNTGHTHNTGHTGSAHNTSNYTNKSSHSQQKSANARGSVVNKTV